MPFEVVEAATFVSNRITYSPDGGTMETKTSIVRRLDVPPLAHLSLSIAVDWTTEDRSMVTCTGELRDTSGSVVASGELVFSPESDAGRVWVPLSRFPVTVTGTYTRYLYVDGFCVDTDVFEIASL